MNLEKLWTEKTKRAKHIKESNSKLKCCNKVSCKQNFSGTELVSFMLLTFCFLELVTVVGLTHTGRIACATIVHIDLFFGSKEDFRLQGSYTTNIHEQQINCKYKVCICLSFWQPSPALHLKHGSQIYQNVSCYSVSQRFKIRTCLDKNFREEKRNAKFGLKSFS